MSVTKRITGNYTLINRDTALGTPGNVTIVTDTMFIDGNLLVGGNSTSVNHESISVTNSFITLNQGETGAGVSLGSSGIEIDRGTLANVALIWNETSSAWQITADGTTFRPIATYGIGGALQAIVEDTNPELGGNLNITGHTIYDTDNNVQIYANTTGSGGTGIHVTNSNYANVEIMNAQRSIAYSILFG
jgi:hypothetical protein